MSGMPEGWSVEIQADQVVVRVPRTAHSEHHVTAEEARGLANELGLAYLAATGVLGVSDWNAVRSALKDYTTLTVPELGIDAYARQVYEALRERVLDAGYAHLAAEFSAESVEEATREGRVRALGEEIAQRSSELNRRLAAFEAERAATRAEVSSAAAREEDNDWDAVAGDVSGVIDASGDVPGAPPASRIFGQLPNLVVSEDFDDLPVDEAELGDSATLGYEIRDYREDADDRARIEAWLLGWHWPAVRAVQRGYGWLVFVDPQFAALAGLGDVHLTGVDATSPDEALAWVHLLAALYVKAAAK